MSNAAFIVAYGPEVRSFLHSGFYSSCSDNHKIVVSNLESEVVSRLRVEAVKLPEFNESSLLSKLRQLNMRLSEASLSSLGHSKWRHTIGKSTDSKKRDLISKIFYKNTVIESLLVSLENVVQSIKWFSADAINFLKMQNIEIIYYSAYSDKRTNAIVLAAKKVGIKTVLIPNSWKDFYTRPRISPVPDEIWVLDEATKSNYLKINRGISPSAIKIRNSLHIDSLKKYSQDSNKSVSSVIGIDPAKPFVCYTTAAPNAVVSEELIVKGIAEKLCAEGIQTLVRVNPMEVGNRFESALQGIDGVFINRPAWEWNRGLDWCCASSEDCELWAMVLKEMKLNISIPSTVTLEAIAFGKPVVNVAYDTPNAVDPAHSNLRYWNSSFYESMREHHSVHKATNIDELVQKVVKLID